MLARSNYEVQFRPGQQLSERIIFPATPSQTQRHRGCPVRPFPERRGPTSTTRRSPPSMARWSCRSCVETSDFLRFRFITLNGPAAQNKGMALFPRKIDGLYAMLSRQDNENIYLMFSDNVHFWNEPEVLLRTGFPVGAGPARQLRVPHRDRRRAGWSSVTASGPMREYRIGAFLLDRDDPTKVIGRLREPLLQPNQRRAGRLRAQRRLYLRRPGPQRRTDHSLRSGRSRHRFRHRPARRGAGGHGVERMSHCMARYESHED